MKTRMLLIIGLSVMMFALVTTASAQNIVLSPHSAYNLLFGPATKSYTPIQREIVYKEKCFNKEMVGEGVVTGITKTNIEPFLDMRWVVKVDIDKQGLSFLKVFKVFLVLNDSNISSATSLKVGDKVKFNGIIWKVVPTLTVGATLVGEHPSVFVLTLIPGNVL